CNLISSYLPHSRSIDHLRYTPDMPSIGMHFLLKELILSLQQQGIQEFNLGLSPLSGLEDRAQLNLPEKVLRAAKAVGQRYYSFKGLEQFKGKFDPRWEPRYIYYKGPSANLFKVFAALSKAMAAPNK